MVSLGKHCQTQNCGELESTMIWTIIVGIRTPICLLILTRVGKVRVATVEIRHGNSSGGHLLSEIPGKLTTPLWWSWCPGGILAGGCTPWSATFQSIENHDFFIQLLRHRFELVCMSVAVLVHHQVWNPRFSLRRTPCNYWSVSKWPAKTVNDYIKWMVPTIIVIDIQLVLSIRISHSIHMWIHYTSYSDLLYHGIAWHDHRLCGDLSTYQRIPKELRYWHKLRRYHPNESAEQRPYSFCFGKSYKGMNINQFIHIHDPKCIIGMSFSAPIQQKHFLVQTWCWIFNLM